MQLHSSFLSAPPLPPTRLRSGSTPVAPAAFAKASTAFLNAVEKKDLNQIASFLREFSRLRKVDVPTFEILLSKQASAQAAAWEKPVAEFWTVLEGLRTFCTQEFIKGSTTLSREQPIIQTDLKRTMNRFNTTMEAFSSNPTWAGKTSYSQAVAKLFELQFSILASLLTPTSTLSQEVNNERLHYLATASEKMVRTFEAAVNNLRTSQRTKDLAPIDFKEWRSSYSAVSK